MKIAIQKKLILSLAAGLILFFSISIITIPSPPQPLSHVLLSTEGLLLNAKLAADQQWRFQSADSIPIKFKKALLLFEDQYFQFHPGINPVSMFRAIRENITAGHVVSGGSTITMQDIRLRSNHSKRSVWNKLIEIFWAVGLELKWSKRHIINDYVSRAPFGTNIIGIEAASWRYFDKPSYKLSWAEAACLAVLPNSPAIIHPGKNRNILMAKRNALLDKLYQHGDLDQTTLQLSKLEPLPVQPLPLPNVAPHALDFITKFNPLGGSSESTIEYPIQTMINDLADYRYKDLSQNQIFNLAILVAETRSGKVIAYCGNPPHTIQSLHVDHVQAPRSTGSILKPILYSAANYRGYILPHTLLPDIPTVIEGFQPKNFSLEYSGATPADKALIQSLNIPFVILLRQYGLEQFYYDLQKLGFKTINKGPSHYGLSLILGGAETTLWDLVGSYSTLGRTLLNYQEYDHRYTAQDLHSLILLKNKKSDSNPQVAREPFILSAASIYNTLNVLKKLQRPDEEGKWESFNSNQDISWKTGTSFGFRDAWAIGINSHYTIGIWAGNSNGEGRHGLLGVKVAAPILFDVFSRLPHHENNSFPKPQDELISVSTCKISGMKASENCPDIDTITISRFFNQSLPCNDHKPIWINPKTGNRMTQSCSDFSFSQKKIIFNLPTLQEHYYASLHADYELMPPLDPSCPEVMESHMMNIILPEPNSTIYIPKEQNGKPGEVVFKLAHRHPETVVYWHLDEKYLGNTKTFHELSVHAETGDHTLTLVDENGVELTCNFKVLKNK